MRNKDKIIRWAILVFAFALFFTHLSLKPPHPDEGVNGFFVNQIWENGFFTYDPANYHGPLLFYLFQISEKIFGFGVGSFRIVTVLFSLLSIGLILRNHDLLGRYSTLFAGAALALSPGMTFFGRSAIHESVYVFFQILLVLGFLKAAEQSGRKGILLAFAGLLGCILLKETFVILLFSLVLAWSWAAFSPFLSGRKNSGMEPFPRRSFAVSDRPFILRTVLFCAFIWLAFFTGFFHHWHGALDFFVALTPWLKTGMSGSGHEKPFYYWLNLLQRYEWAAAAGLAGAVAGIFARSWKMRLFSALAIINGLVYSIISYKTPWCIITIMWPFVVVAGLWAEFFFVKRSKTLISWLCIAAAVIIAAQSVTASIRLNFIHYTDPSEPYVYVQTKNDLKIVEEIIRKKILSSADSHNMRIQVNLNESWPLPWLFSRFPNAVFGGAGEAFTEKADIIFAELSHTDRDIAGEYWWRVIDLREARQPVYVYLKKTYFQGMELPGFRLSDMPREKGI